MSRKQTGSPNRSCACRSRKRQNSLLSRGNLKAFASSACAGTGSPLPASERAFFEPPFGADLSQVRVHTDSRAAQLSQAVSAKAFTVGQDVAFGSPNTTEGRKLLAHELTHTLQQREGEVSYKLMKDAGAPPPAPSKKGKVKSGPKYTPNGTITPTESGGMKTATFTREAEFEHDPANNIHASCAEIRQYIKWTAGEVPPRHAGFEPACRQRCPRQHMRTSFRNGGHEQRRLSL